MPPLIFFFNNVFDEPHNHEARNNLLEESDCLSTKKSTKCNMESKITV